MFSFSVLFTQQHGMFAVDNLLSCIICPTLDSPLLVKVECMGCHPLWASAGKVRSLVVTTLLGGRWHSKINAYNPFTMLNSKCFYSREALLLEGFRNMYTKFNKLSGSHKKSYA